MTMGCWMEIENTVKACAVALCRLCNGQPGPLLKIVQMLTAPKRIRYHFQKKNLLNLFPCGNDLHAHQTNHLFLLLSQNTKHIV
jgi:hypothetical protein